MDDGEQAIMMDGWVDETDEWVGRWAGGWIDEWVDRLVARLMGG